MGYKVHESLDLSKISLDIRKFWEDHDIFKKSLSKNEDKKFVFYEGCPSANGTPGIHHVMARTIKDIFCRYKTMQGFQVKRKGGWDTHGLPVELQVEKELGITKEDIGKKISIEEYNQKCRETVMKFKDQWDELTRKMGYWVDLENPYITYQNEYIESCWWLLKELYKKDLLYKGYTIQPYSPAAGTGLSSHELNQPGTYKDVRDTTIVAQFKAKRSHILDIPEIENIYFLAWTTTPWTLPSNSALAVGEDIDYVIVKTVNQYTQETINVVLAKECLSRYFKEPLEELDIKKELKGRELVNIGYEQLMPYVTPMDSYPFPKNCFYVISGDFVDVSSGTGIVHIAPHFGADDFRVAKDSNILAITSKENGKDVPLVDKSGRFVKEMNDEIFGFSGEFVKEAYLSEEEKEAELLKQRNSLIKNGILTKLDKYMSVDERIALKLKMEGKAFKVEKYEHSYPHCWRTDKPILYYPLDSWFIKTSSAKDRLVELNKTINWKPESTGTGRFGNWLENTIDWNLSRSRYWGTPLPIWMSDDKTETKCIGSLEELKFEIEKANEVLNLSQPTTLEDLHRPYVDNVILVSESGKPLTRETDIVDVWFDSGSSPYAQLHYPFENKELIDNGTAYPADFISEGVDQTRGWFYTLHVISVLLFDKPAFKNVISTGLVLDKNGTKMAKRLGNTIDPFKTLDEFGADAVRWYMVSNSNPWDNLKFNLDGVSEVQRKIFRTLYNTYNFYAMYANLDKVDDFVSLYNFTNPNDKPELDRWILSKLGLLVKKVTECYEDYDATGAARAIEEFVDADLSNWYVRLSRKRFWKSELDDDKKSGYAALNNCLSVVARLMCPIAPHFGEWLYKNIHEDFEGTSSVHLADFPDSRYISIDEKLCENMDIAQRLCSMVHSVRKKNKLRVRLPLNSVMIYFPGINFQILREIGDIIESETNVKKIGFLDVSDSTKFKKSITPDLKKLGKTLGKNAFELKTFLSNLTQKEISKFEKSKVQKVEFSDGSKTSINIDEVFIKKEDIEGLSSMTEDELTIMVDIAVTDELKKEGIARDFINKVQTLRKEINLDVIDRIDISVKKKDEFVDSALYLHLDYICRETQSNCLKLVDETPEGSVVEMDDFTLEVKVEKTVFI